MEAAKIWACDLPAFGRTSDNTEENFDVRVNAHRNRDGEVLFDLIKLAHEPELKGFIINSRASDLRRHLEGMGVIEARFNAMQVAMISGDALPR